MTTFATTMNCKQEMRQSLTFICNHPAPRVAHDGSLEPFGTPTRCDVETGRHLLQEGRLQVTSIPSRQFVGAFVPPRGLIPMAD